MILYTNAQSLLGKIPELEAVTADLSPNIILICETWYNASTNTANLLIQNYELQPALRQDRADTANGIGGGLIVYTKTGLSVLPCDNGNFNQYCKLRINDQGENTFIYLIYRPPSVQDNIVTLAELVSSTEKNAVFVGDFNLPSIDWGNGTARGASDALLQAATENGFSQLVDFATHIRGNCLDLILTNIPGRVDNITEAGRLGKSDHVMIQFELSVGERRRAESRRVKNWKRANWEEIRRGLENTVWPTTSDEVTPEEAWTTTIRRATLDSLLIQNVPESEFHPRGPESC